MTLTDDTVLHAPPVHASSVDGFELLVDAAAPSWLATDARGAEIFGLFDGRRSVADVVATYAASNGLTAVRAWQHVDTLARDSLRAGFLAPEARESTPYLGRTPHVSDLPLEELWLHTNNSCNLTCTHCLVSSGPDGDRGLPLATLLDVVAQARSLGMRRVFVTGGEPFLRRDLMDVVDAVLADPEAEIAILTNAMLLPGARLDALAQRDLTRVRLQVSVDGATVETNDAIRGAGSLEKTLAGVRAAAAAGVDLTLCSVVTASNAAEIPGITRLAAEHGARRHHLLWLHKRGRADGDGPDETPTPEQLADVVRAARVAADECGIVLDNHEALKARLRAPSGVKRDLSNACVTSLCVYADGGVYPSAATAGQAELLCGSVLESPLADIWRSSGVVQRFRAASVVEKPLCRECPLMYVCGGGDLEHAYFWGGSLDAHDPYCELHKEMYRDAWQDLVHERRAHQPGMRAGFDAPVALAAMGEEGVHCATEEEPPAVLVSRSECVLSFDLDAPRTVVQEFYGDAAETPQAELCCPVQPAQEDLTHIPEEVVDRFYGCGSPVAAAGIQPGETTLDLGSGAGIDVFIAARRVGPTGRAIGVDMTAQMLEVARAARPQVAERLGFDVAEFHEGFLEDVPVEDETVDLVTSNCVVNLSPDKKRVFAEIWRVLRDHGRVVLSDIVSEREVPSHMRRNPRLWGECISGALTEAELIDYLERAGFFGIRVLSRTHWKDVDDERFFSVTVEGHKFEKREGCVFAGHWATYLGPFKGVSDEEGHWFPRNQKIEICTDTLAKLARPPYGASFLIEGPQEEIQGEVPVDARGCDPETGCC